MSAITFLDAVTATGVPAGLDKKFANLVRNHTVAVTTTGSPTAVTVILEGSIDGVNWYPLVTHVFSAGEITATKAMFHGIDKPVTYARVNLDTLTGGTTPTVTALYEGDELSLKKISRRGSF